MPHDERLYVDGARRRWKSAFDRHEHLNPQISYGSRGTAADRDPGGIGARDPAGRCT